MESGTAPSAERRSAASGLGDKTSRAISERKSGALSVKKGTVDRKSIRGSKVIGAIKVVGADKDEGTAVKDTQPTTQDALPGLKADAEPSVASKKFSCLPFSIKLDAVLESLERSSASPVERASVFLDLNDLFSHASDSDKCFAWQYELCRAQILKSAIARPEHQLLERANAIGVMLVLASAPENMKLMWQDQNVPDILLRAATKETPIRDNLFELAPRKGVYRCWSTDQEPLASRLAAYWDEIRANLDSNSPSDSESSEASRTPEPPEKSPPQPMAQDKNRRPTISEQKTMTAEKAASPAKVEVKKIPGKLILRKGLPDKVVRDDLQTSGSVPKPPRNSCVSGTKEEREARRREEDELREKARSSFGLQRIEEKKKYDDDKEEPGSPTPVRKARVQPGVGRLESVDDGKRKAQKEIILLHMRWNALATLKQLAVDPSNVNSMWSRFEMRETVCFWLERRDNPENYMLSLCAVKLLSRGSRNKTMWRDKRVQSGLLYAFSVNQPPYLEKALNACCNMATDDAVAAEIVKNDLFVETFLAACERARRNSDVRLWPICLHLFGTLAASLVNCVPLFKEPRVRTELLVAGRHEDMRLVATKAWWCLSLAEPNKVPMCKEEAIREALLQAAVVSDNPEVQVFAVSALKNLAGPHANELLLWSNTQSRDVLTQLSADNGLHLEIRLNVVELLINLSDAKANRESMWADGRVRDCVLRAAVTPTTNDEGVTPSRGDEQESVPSSPRVGRSPDALQRQGFTLLLSLARSSRNRHVMWSDPGVWVSVRAAFEGSSELRQLLAGFLWTLAADPRFRDHFWLGPTQDLLLQLSHESAEPRTRVLGFGAIRCLACWDENRHRMWNSPALKVNLFQAGLLEDESEFSMELRSAACAVLANLAVPVTNRDAMWHDPDVMRVVGHNLEAPSMLLTAQQWGLRRIALDSFRQLAKYAASRGAIVWCDHPDLWHTVCEIVEQCDPQRNVSPRSMDAVSLDVSPYLDKTRVAALTPDASVDYKTRSQSLAHDTNAESDSILSGSTRQELFEQASAAIVEVCSAPATRRRAWVERVAPESLTARIHKNAAQGGRGVEEHLLLRKDDRLWDKPTPAWNRPEFVPSKRNKLMFSDDEHRKVRIVGRAYDPPLPKQMDDKYLSGQPDWRKWWPKDALHFEDYVVTPFKYVGSRSHKRTDTAGEPEARRQA